MSLIETMWGHLDVGSLIVDANGEHWRVRERRVSPDHDIALLVTTPSGERGQWIVKRHEDEVILADESAGRAVDVVLGVLAGSVKMEPMPTGPDNPKTRALYRAHLIHHHGGADPGTPKETPALAGLIEYHAILHAAAQPLGIPHTHDLTF